MNEYKLYIIIRTDRKFSIGKMLVHCGHICSKIVFDMISKDFELPDRLDYWYGGGMTQTKIVLKEYGLEDIMYYYSKAKEKGLPCACIEDAGYYEVEKGTVLMVGIGPITKEESVELGLDKLSLYKG